MIFGKLFIRISKFIIIALSLSPIFFWYNLDDFYTLPCRNNTSNYKYIKSYKSFEEKTKDEKKCFWILIENVIYVILFYVFLIWLFKKLYLIGNKLNSIDYDQILESDKRAPVLYLRDFVTDTKIFKELSDFDIKDHADIIFKSGSEESQLRSSTNPIGPMIAFEDKNQNLSQVGAARLASNDEEWKNLALRQFKDSKAIVLYFSRDILSVVRGQFKWEIIEVFKRVSINKIIIIIRPRKIKFFNVVKWAKEFKDFVNNKDLTESINKFLNSSNNSNLNLNQIMGILIWFDKGKNLYLENLFIPKESKDKLIYQGSWRKYPIGKEFYAMYHYALIPYFFENKIAYQPIIKKERTSKGIEKLGWEKAKELNTVESYQEFLANHPNSKLEKKAIEKINKLHKVNNNS